MTIIMMMTIHDTILLAKVDNYFDILPLKRYQSGSRSTGGTHHIYRKPFSLHSYHSMMFGIWALHFFRLHRFAHPLVYYSAKTAAERTHIHVVVYYNIIIEKCSHSSLAPFRPSCAQRWTNNKNGVSDSANVRTDKRQMRKQQIHTRKHTHSPFVSPLELMFLPALGKS